MSVKRLDLGAVSAYAMAVEQGYQGTEEEFGLILANAANYAAESKTAKIAAEAAAVESAGSAQAAEGYKTAAGKILEDVRMEGTSQIQAISTAGEEEIQDLEAKGTEQIQAIETAGSEQTEAAKAEIDAKGKQTLDSIPEDYIGLQTEVDELKSDIINLPLPIVRTNLFDGIYERITGKTWIRGPIDLVTTDNSDYDIVSVKVEAGKSYIIKFIAASVTASVIRTDCRFADINNTLVSDLSLVGEFNKAFTMPANVVTLHMTVPTGYNPVVAESEAFPYNEDFNYFINDSVTIPRIEKTVEQSNLLIDSIIKDSINLADASKFNIGKYMTNLGGIGNNDSYFYTEHIYVEPNDVIFASAEPRWTCCFDENGNVVENSSNPNPSGWTVPNNVCSIVLTGYINNIDDFVVSKGSLIPYTPYQKRINYDLVSMHNIGNVYGRNGLTKSEPSLSANTAIEFNEFPKSLMKGTSITGIVYFSEFDSITFGVGNSSGIYFVIDGSTIKTYSDSTLIDTKNHNLTISKYLSFSLMVKDDIRAYVTIDSVDGSSSMDISVSYNFDGFPFFKSTNDNTDVKVSVTNNDFKKSVWWFGDSYSGWAEYRVLGQLKSLGVTDGMLIDAVPGQRSYYDSNNGAYVDFSKAIAFGLPKYLVWAIGMNDSDLNYKIYIDRIAKFCELMHIELIVVKPPIVPSVDNSEINAYIDSKGFRFIDWNKAVVANSSGVWYTGMLSTDNVHPNETGAKALAMRTVTDFVEITQYR